MGDPMLTGLAADTDEGAVRVSGPINEAGLEMTLVDYQPLYRSAAGTGSGMAFAYWR